jgi:hypothetical protein
MSLVPFSEFLEHRKRRLNNRSVLRDLSTLNDAGEHHPDTHDKKNVDETSHRVGADGSEQPEHNENQRER